jgi:hypothetical protein
VYEAWVEVCKTLPTGVILHYTIQHMGRAGVEAGKDAEGNIMGYESVPQTIMFSLVLSFFFFFFLFKNRFPFLHKRANYATNTGWIVACEWPKDDSDDSDTAAQKAMTTMLEAIQSLAEPRGFFWSTSV